MVSTALLDISPRFPMGVATMYKPKKYLSLFLLFIFILSCTSVNLSNQTSKSNNKKTVSIKKTEKIHTKNDTDKENIVANEQIKRIFSDSNLNKSVNVLFSNKNKQNIINQFTNVLELGVYDKRLQNVNLELRFFENPEELKQIIYETKNIGKIYIGPIESEYTKIAKNYCDDGVVFFSFSSNTSLAEDCIYLLNFFPKNELEQLFAYLENDSKVALLYPENEYGYMINSLIDKVANNSNAIIVNRASYKNDLSNVRDAIKELGKYELRKYELSRQKQILSNKNDSKSKQRLKKLQKFKTTNDYDFTHILIADYGINLLQVAPLLTYYDIDPNIVQFMGTGVIDDQNFFFEPSLQGAIFPGIEKKDRSKLINRYGEIYEENFIRISTLPYDLIGLLNYVFLNEMKLYEFLELLNNSNIKFEGVDGSFYFKDNIIERNLKILKIENGKAIKIN